ncbi:MAG: hypothetical protein GXO86_00315 [Chlorobi bacterium]|nr:hypothetical protein [Chlorobiota bacterium]
MKRFISLVALLFIAFQTFTQINATQFKPGEFQFRALGPYRTGSWISEIAVPKNNDPKYKYTWYVASRNGGVWKTENNGTTFFPVFDSIESPAIGALTVSASNPEIVWVGTGEDFNARLSHSGTGIYKTTDGGKTWVYKGLPDSHHISVILVHPQNPDIVYAAVMGHLFSPNEERGVFKTTDGGNSWTKVLYIDENTGIIDMVMDPENPDILYAAAYEKYRYPWHFEAGGKNSRIYKTTDGGNTWKKLTNGLPDGKLGRIGLAIFPKNPRILFAVVEILKPYIPTGHEEEMDMHMKPVGEVIWGDVFKTTDGGEHWTKMNNDTVNVSDKAPYSFNKIYVDPDDADKIYVLSMTMPYSRDGGKTWEAVEWGKGDLMKNVFGDFRTLWIDPQDGRHMLIGSDGGLYESFDGGYTATHLYQIPLGEVYNISADMEEPYNVYCGLQDHEVWKGPVNSWKGYVSLEDWFLVGKWDGMYCPVDTVDNRWLYSTTQFGGHIRVDQKTGTRVNIEPKAPKGHPRYRFPWDPPLIISPHNPEILYTGGQMLLQSLDRGDTWIELSPDLTTNDSVKIAGKGHMMYCTITTISESPVKAGVIWVGTDDGRVHVTPDFGRTWIEVTDKLTSAGAPANRWVTRVFASNFTDSTAYVCKSGFKFDDFSPYVFKTTDMGRTWVNISEGLPAYPVNVIIEDTKNPDLLFAGNDLGIYFSLDGGESWQRMEGNIPNVPVNDLVIHPRENDLIAGTYGRGMYIANINWLQQMTSDVPDYDVWFFDIQPRPVNNISDAAFWGNNKLMGDTHLFTPNEPNGLRFDYRLKKKLKEKPEFFIYNDQGQPMDTLTGPNREGINTLFWHTWDQPPGTYKVVMKAGKTEIIKYGILKPRIVYHVMNWKD